MENRIHEIISKQKEFFKTGRTGFETFSHIKSIVDKKTWLDIPMRYQPYTEKTKKLIRAFLK